MTKWRMIKDSADLAHDLLFQCWKSGHDKMSASEALIMRPLYSLAETAIREFAGEPDKMGATMAEAWLARLHELSEAFSQVRWSNGKTLAHACQCAIAVPVWYAIELAGHEHTMLLTRPHVRLGQLYRAALDLGAQKPQLASLIDMFCDVPVHTAAL